MTRQRPVLGRGPAALVLVAFALLAGPTPEAVAQTPPRPEPQELWRQFPLETRRSTRQAPTERESTPAAAATGGTAEEGRDESLVTVQIATILLAMALVLILTTATLAYAVRGSFEFGAYRRRRRLTPSFHEFVEAPLNAGTERPEHTEPSAKRRVRIPSRAHRGVKRAAAAKTLGSIISEVDALKAKLEMHPAPAKRQSIAHDELETLKEKLDVQPAHSESAPPDELQTLKAKLEMQSSPAKSGSTPHDELETLKAKLAKQAAFVNDERETADEVALKEKLVGDAAAAAKRETTVRPALEAKLVDHDPGPKSERKVDLHVEKPSPAAPRRVSAATHRSTIAELLYEHGSDLAFIGVVVIMLALLLLNIAVFLGIGVAS